MADVAKHAAPSVLQTLNIFLQDVDGIAGGATALLLGATSLAMLRSRALPSWLAYVGLVLAIAVLRHSDARPAHRGSLAASHQRRGSRHLEKAENHRLTACAATKESLVLQRRNLEWFAKG